MSAAAAGLAEAEADAGAGGGVLEGHPEADRLALKDVAQTPTLGRSEHSDFTAETTTCGAQPLALG